MMRNAWIAGLMAVSLSVLGAGAHAEGDCPGGQESYEGACWACPVGFERTDVAAPSDPKACRKAGEWEYTQAWPARRDPEGPISRCRGFRTFSEAGSCWKCPPGYRRAPLRSAGGIRPSCRRRQGAVYVAATPQMPPE